MTCIVGYIDKEGVYIGGDSAALDVNELSYDLRADEKVFKRGDMIFGFSVSFRMGQLLRYKLRIPAHPRGMDSMTYMATLFIDAVRKCFDDNAYTAMNTDDGGYFIVGYRGGLFEIQSDYQVSKPRASYIAIGSGRAFSLGAIYATKERDPFKKLEIALTAASNFSMAVKPPFVFEKLINKKKPVKKVQPKIKK